MSEQITRRAALAGLAGLFSAGAASAQTLEKAPVPAAPPADPFPPVVDGRCAIYPPARMNVPNGRGGTDTVMGPSIPNATTCVSGNDVYRVRPPCVCGTDRSGGPYIGP